MNEPHFSLQKSGENKGADLTKHNDLLPASVCRAVVWKKVFERIHFLVPMNEQCISSLVANRKNKKKP